jgi:uncharacterized protein
MEAYRPEITARIYAELRRKAELVARAGYSAVIDAVHAREEERSTVAELADQLSLPFVGLWLDVPVPVLLNRVRHRSGGASDADPTIVARQAGCDIGNLDWHRLDASGELEILRRAALARVERSPS